MKKKAKLFTTIASLCMAVALMAFGVYAATKATFTITNTVKFDAAANVRATVTVAMTSNNTGYQGTVTAPDAVTLDGTEAADYTKTMTLGDINLTPTDANTDMVYEYTITIKNNAGANDANNKLAVAFTKVPAAIDVSETQFHELTVKAGTEDVTTATTATIEAQGSYVITVTLKVDHKQSLAQTDLGVVFSLTAQE